MTVDPILVQVKDAIGILGQSRRTIYGLIAAEKIKAVKSGRSTLIVYESLKQYAAGLPSAKIKGYGRVKRGAEPVAA